jgi:hypothetical protein
MLGFAGNKDAEAFVSRHTPSRSGPRHCGQSAADDSALTLK